MNECEVFRRNGVLGDVRCLPDTRCVARASCCEHMEHCLNRLWSLCVTILLQNLTTSLFCRVSEHLLLHKIGSQGLTACLHC